MTSNSIMPWFVYTIVSLSLLFQPNYLYSFLTGTTIWMIKYMIILIIPHHTDFQFGSGPWVLSGMDQTPHPLILIIAMLLYQTLVNT